MLSQIIRFTLPSPLTISAPVFSKLRREAAAAGASAQYYGYSVAVKLSALPKKRHEICWVILWPVNADRRPVMNELKSVSVGDATSLVIPFVDRQQPTLTTALDAPVCEFACIRLSDDAPLSDASLQRSMEKTCTDTYKIAGFTGGDWGYAINTNETRGVSCSSDSEGFVPETERRLGIYFLGWESIEVRREVAAHAVHAILTLDRQLHEDGMQTPEFAEEIVKLMPYFGPGSGAWYAGLRKHE